MKKEKLNHNGQFLAYVRVSSKDQALGMSLDVQREQIDNYAREKNIKIAKYFGGVESASKAGREEFGEMLETLVKGKYQGICYHKIDRSGRNPTDQARLYELMELGYEFHFVAERYSTNDPTGKMTLYLLWAVASGFSDNLKFEINKGIFGLLRDGKYPNPAPVGFRDAGRGVKELDPKLAPIVKKAFEWYSKGDISVENLHNKLNSLGFTDKRGNKTQFKMLYKLLRNSFYYGLIKYNGESFTGSHTPIIDKALFDKVQVVLDSKGAKHTRKFHYLFSNLITCRVCQSPTRCLSAKGRYKYYSCRNKACKFNLREQVVDEIFFAELQKLEFNNSEVKLFLKAVEVFRSDLVASKADEIKHIELELAKLREENERLLNLLLRQDITNEEYKNKKSKNTNREIEFNERKNALINADEQTVNSIAEIGKLLERPSLPYRLGSDEKKVSLIKSLVENFSWEGDQLTVQWKNQYKVIAERNKNTTETGDVIVGSATGNRTPIWRMKTACPNR